MHRELPATFVLLWVCAGCAQMQANARAKELQQILDPMLGVATREQIATRFGIPDRRQQIGTLDLWEYHKSFGMRGTSSGYGSFSPTGVSTFGNASAREVYDSMTLTFSAQGILLDWQAYVQR